jgi:uncharacterized membrane protein
MLTTDKKLNIILALTYLAYFGLIALFSYTFIVDENHSWKLWLFQSIPLLIVLPGLIKKHYRAHSWLCFIILAYFTAYVAEVGSPLGEPTDWIGLLLSIVIFIGAMMSSRKLQRL